MLLSVFIVVFTAVIVIVCVRSKKKSRPQTDILYDDINIGHHSEPPSVIETEANVAYGHVKSS